MPGPLPAQRARQNPQDLGEMVAAAIRTIFAQPTGTEVTEQLDKVVTILQLGPRSAVLRLAGAVLIKAHDE